MSSTLQEAPAPDTHGVVEPRIWPHLKCGEIHVWKALLDDVAHEQDHALLSPDEVERASRYRFAQDRLRFVAGRARLRTILGGYLGRDPAELILSRGPHGKPRLFPREGEETLHFNVSHSDSVALYAVAREGPVGIDIERIREIPDWADIAGSCFPPGEQIRLRRLPAERRMRGFLEAWTRQEALLKASGEGLTGENPGSVARRAEYSLHPLAPAPGYLATLASSFEPLRVVFLTWSDVPASTAFSLVET